MIPKSLDTFLNNVYRFLAYSDLAVGIDVQPTGAVIAAVRNTRHGVKVQDVQQIQIEDGRLSAEKVQEFLQKHYPNAASVVVGLPVDAALFKVVHLTGVAVEDLPEYLSAHEDAIIPAYLNTPDVSVKSEFLTSDGGITMAVWIYRPDHIFQLYREQYAGIAPLRVEYCAASHTTIVNALRPDFHGVIFLGDANGIQAYVYREGMWCDMVGFSEGTGMTDDVDRITLIYREKTLDEKLPEYWFWGENEHFNMLTEHLINAGWQVYCDPRLPEPGTQHARALAMEAFYHEQLLPDFTPVEQGDTRNEIRFKYQTRKSVRLGGILIAALAILLLGMEHYQKWRYSHHESEQMQLAPLVTEIDSLKTSLATLKKSLEQHQRLTGEKTQVAYYLYRLGEALPDQVWLEEVRFKKDKKGKLAVYLNGLSINEGDVARWLGTLEQLPFARDIVLDEMVNYQGTTARKRSARHNKIVAFQVHFNVAG